MKKSRKPRKSPSKPVNPVLLSLHPTLAYHIHHLIKTASGTAYILGLTYNHHVFKIASQLFHQAILQSDPSQSYNPQLISHTNPPAKRKKSSPK